MSTKPKKPIPPINDVVGRASAEVPILGANRAEILALHPVAKAQAPGLAPQLAALEHACFFLGHPRSGHSLLGAMLDAHPETCIAHELDALRFVQEGWQTPELWWAIIENARRSAAIGRRWGQYSYGLPGQGTWTRIRVIGDKKGGMTARAIYHNAGAIEQLTKTVALPIRWLHVVRDPWDNIATIQRKAGIDMWGAIRVYFGLATGVDIALAMLPADEVLTLFSEDLLNSPADVLQTTAAHLGLQSPPHWLQACTALVRHSRVRARDRVSWTPAHIRVVVALSAKHRWLERYADHP